jgi:hypothetical protein
VVLELDETSLAYNGHHEGVSIKLACAIIAVTPAGHTLESVSLPLPVAAEDRVELSGSRLQTVVSETI